MRLQVSIITTFLGMAAFGAAAPSINSLQTVYCCDLTCTACAESNIPYSSCDQCDEVSEPSDLGLTIISIRIAPTTAASHHGLPLPGPAIFIGPVSLIIRQRLLSGHSSSRTFQSPPSAASRKKS